MCDGILRKFKLIQALVVVLIVCKNKDLPANSEVGNGILLKFKLFQALLVVLIVCKNHKDPVKIESTRVVTTFLPL